MVTTGSGKNSASCGHGRMSNLRFGLRLRLELNNTGYILYDTLSIETLYIDNDMILTYNL